MRTLIYARYSSDLQNARSIEDQVAVCAARAEREGWTIVGVHTDAALAGDRGLGEDQRPGLAALFSRIEAGGINQLLTESMSRLARHEGDSHALRERLKFHEVRLFTLTDGVVDDFRGSVRALIDAQARRDIAANVRRGQRGTVVQGRIAAGLAYGYALANEIGPRGEFRRGLRSIDEHQAGVVREIFSTFAAGTSPSAIAERLNARGEPAPAGGKWAASTIQGDSKRGSGILKNRIYIGEIVHNRTRKVKHPATRRELIRPNEAWDHVSGAAPHLRIVDDALWQAVQDEIARRSTGPISQQRRPKKLLSGLVHCGLCGGSVIIRQAGRWGCGGAKTGKGCTNMATIDNERLERESLAALVDGLAAPELIETWIAEYTARRRERIAGLAREIARLVAQEAEVERMIDRLVEAIASGAGAFAEVRDRLGEAKARQASLAAERRALEGVSEIAIHPGVAAEYRRQLADLATLCADPATRDDVAPRVRALLGRVIVTPIDGARGLAVTVEGRLAALLGLPEIASNPTDEHQLDDAQAPTYFSA